MGCVYILKNPAMPDLIKIGYTDRTAEERARELYHGANGVPKPFVVVHREDCEEPKELETVVHEKLANYRINENREFFNCPVDAAYQLLKDLQDERRRGHRPLKELLVSFWKKIKESRFFELLKFLIYNILFENLKHIWSIIWDIIQKSRS